MHKDKKSMRRLFIWAVFLTLTMASSQTVIAQSSVSFRKTDWTVSEVKEWAEKQKAYPTWYGLLMYQGSDTLKHHFISRVMDEWVWFDIKRTDIKIAEEKPVQKKTSSTPLGYYYVDATKDFIKVEAPKLH